MSIRPATNFFITSSYGWYGGFYQYLLTRASTLTELGNKLVRDAESAFAFRQTRKLDEIGTLLSNLPIRECQLIGQYYRAWCAYRGGESPQSEFESVFTNSRTYKARALISIAALKARDGDYDAEIEYFTESKKYSADPTIWIKAAKGIAVAKAKQGYHRAALKDLENLSTVIKQASPDLYYDCLNSLAVELGEAGRKYEARSICHHVLASPFAIAYPEWRETAEELRGPNRSFAALSPSPPRMGKLLTMPAVERAGPARQGRPARVINLESWKAKMGKKKNGDKSLEELDSRELLLRLMELGTATEMTDDKLHKVVAMMESLLSEPDEPQMPDDDDTGA
jgi:hypothetical protein